MSHGSFGRADGDPKISSGGSGIWGQSPSPGPALNIVEVPPGGAPVHGSGGGDLFEGSGFSDQMFGLVGNDVMHGHAGSDRIFGDAGNDTLDGGSGDDALFGGAGDDDITGGDGQDQIEGGSGNDTMTGGADRDLFLFREGSGDDVITDYEPGVDTLRFAPGQNGEALTYTTVATKAGLLIEYGDQGDSVLLVGAEFVLGGDLEFLP